VNRYPYALKAADRAQPSGPQAQTTGHHKKLRDHAPGSTQSGTRSTLPAGQLAGFSPSWLQRPCSHRCQAPPHRSSAWM